MRREHGRFCKTPLKPKYPREVRVVPPSGTERLWAVAGLHAVTEPRDAVEILTLSLIAEAAKRPVWLDDRRVYLIKDDDSNGDVREWRTGR